MARVYNFSAGPSVLPESVLRRAAAEMLDYEGSGQSVMEMSHRSKVFDGIIKGCEALLREVMNIPDNYKVLFLQGGASSQFAMIPLNLMNGSGKADFVLTGDIKAELARDPVDINALEELMDDVRTLGLQTDKVQVNASAGEKLMQYVRDFCQDPASLPAAVKTVEFLNYMEIFGFTPDTSQAQQQVFKALQSLPAQERGKSILTALARKLKIAI